MKLILAAGMEEGWLETEYPSSDELTERVDSLNEQLAPKEFEGIPVGYALWAILGLLLLGFAISRYFEKREIARNAREGAMKEKSDEIVD